MKADAIIDGVKPKRGMWLVSHGRQRAYGIITSIRDDSVWWAEPLGATVKTPHEMLHDNSMGYATSACGYAVLQSDGSFRC